jgi:hypothetical protein
MRSNSTLNSSTTRPHLPPRRTLPLTGRHSTPGPWNRHSPPRLLPRTRPWRPCLLWHPLLRCLLLRLPRFPQWLRLRQHRWPHHFPPPQPLPAQPWPQR